MHYPCIFVSLFAYTGWSDCSLHCQQEWTCCNCELSASRRTGRCPYLSEGMEFRFSISLCIDLVYKLQCITIIMHVYTLAHYRVVHHHCLLLVRRDIVM